jgi:hypothetical protein
MAREKKERKLTEAEQRRLDHFNEVGDALVAQGYKRTDLRINMVTANVVSIVGAVVLLALCIVAFSFIHPEVDLASGYSLIVLLAAFVVLIVVHELIHGLTWSRFTPNGFKDVEFGVMWNALAPYCACNAPLKKGPYILGAMMPLITLGIIPLVVAFCIGSVPLLYIGALMVVGATGDILIVLKLLGHKSTATDVLLYDHPTEGGSVIFER